MRKLTATLLLFLVSLATVAQFTERKSFDFRNEPLHSVLERIRKAYGVRIQYKSDRGWQQYLESECATRVTLSVSNLTLTETLNRLEGFQPVFYLSANPLGFIILKPKPIHLQLISKFNETQHSITVQCLSDSNIKVTGSNGMVSFTSEKLADSFYCSGVTIESFVYRVVGRREFFVVPVVLKTNELDAVVFDGFKSQQQDKITSSAEIIGRKWLERGTGSSLAERLFGGAGSILINPSSIRGQLDARIRGENTLQADARPLVILDEFPYEGDLQIINPNDIESITILKDAAAAALWGVRAGNGVIVINTRKGKQNQPFTLQLNNSISIGAQPNLDYSSRILSPAYVQLQQNYFDRGVYNLLELDVQKSAMNPVAELLIRKRDGLISDDEATAQLNRLKRQDARQDLKKYFYRNSFSEQHALNISGGNKDYQYFISGGYDQTLDNVVNSRYNRATFHTNHFLTLFKKIRVNAGVMYAQSRSFNQAAMPYYQYPYERLVGDNGEALPVTMDYRPSVKDSAAALGLPDWQLRPYDELYNRQDKMRQTALRIDAGLSWKFLQNFEFKSSVQRQENTTEQRDFNTTQSYYTRNLVNRFTQVTPAGIVTPVPYGGILNAVNQNLSATNLRLQVEYHFRRDKTEGYFLTGYESRELITDTSVFRQFGLDEQGANPAPVDYNQAYPLFVNANFADFIERPGSTDWAADYIRSWFLSGGITYLGRYAFNLTARKDRWNIFGKNANRNPLPLWAASFLWSIDREKFYLVNWLPHLQFRVSFGYTGNFDRSQSAYTTITDPVLNSYGQEVISVQSVANPNLRWEKTGILNFGADLISKNKIVKLTLEYYRKWAKDLFWTVPVDQTSGQQVFSGNVAGLRGQGIDLSLTTRNVNKALRWESTLLLSYVSDKVTGNENPRNAVWLYADPTINYPIPGQAPYTLYSFPFGGLDPVTGDPLVQKEGQPDKNYFDLLLSDDPAVLVNSGPRNPPVFGSLINDFTWKRWNLNFLISFKLGHYFRRLSVDYDALLYGTSQGHEDYYRRWQKPGDEQVTNVPSLIYHADPFRHDFYKYSTALVEPAGHIRFRDIRLSYDIRKEAGARKVISLLQFYIYANNMGLLWKATGKNLDPDFITGIPTPRYISFGVKMELK